MWPHCDMKIQIPHYLGLTLKIQIPHYLGLTPLFGLDPYIADSVQRQGGSRMQGRTKWVLIYATLRLRLSLRRDWGCGPAPSADAFYAEAGFVLVAS